MRVNRKQLLVFLLVVLALVQVINRWSLHRDIVDEPQLSLEKQVSVANEIRIQVKPVSFTPGDELTFLVSLESTQNPEILDISLTEISLLEDQDGNPYQPKSWKVDISADYSRTGRLVFQGPPQGTKAITLTVFELEERAFTWNLE